MNVLIVDDELGTTAGHELYSLLCRSLRWQNHVFDTSPDDALARVKDGAMSFDLVLVDLSFSKEEDERLKLLDDADDREAVVRQVRGFQLCDQLHREQPWLGIVVVSKHYHPLLINEARRRRVGYLVKLPIPGDAVAALAPALAVIQREMFPGQTALYLELASIFGSGNDVLGQYSRVLNVSYRQFFACSDPWLRYSFLAASLSPLVHSLVNDDKLGQGLRLAEVTSQRLLAATSRSHRDHALHSGNVFWLGIALLARLREHMPRLWGSIRLGKHGQEKIGDIVRSWSFCSLFHDIGVSLEKVDQITTAVSTFLGPNVVSGLTAGAEATHAECHQGLKEIASLLNAAQATQDGTLLELAAEQRTRDHGLLGAGFLGSRLTKAQAFGKGYDSLLLESLRAIALHTAQRWVGNRLWQPPGGVSENLLTYLLAVCDLLQEWERVVDPLAGQSISPADSELELSQITSSDLARLGISPDGERLAIALDITYQFSPRGDVSRAAAEALGRVDAWYRGGSWKAALTISGAGTVFAPVVRYHFPTVGEPYVAVLDASL